MASAIKLLATQMEAMEASFLSVFFTAANKIALLTDSKLFFLMETSDGVHKIGGNQELKFLFQSAKLLPRNSDLVFDEEEAEEEVAPSSSFIETPFSKITSALKESPKKRKSNDESGMKKSAKRSKRENRPIKLENLNFESRSRCDRGGGGGLGSDEDVDRGGIRTATYVNRGAEGDCEGDVSGVVEEGEDYVLDAEEAEKSASDLEFTDDETGRANSKNSESDEWEPDAESVKKKKLHKKSKREYDGPTGASEKPFRQGAQCPKSGKLVSLGPEWKLVDASPLRSEVWKHFARTKHDYSSLRCRSCKSFVSSTLTDLRTHLQQTHGLFISNDEQLQKQFFSKGTGVKYQTKCLTCGFVFRNASTTTLRYHLINKHGIKTRKIMVPQDNGPDG